MHLQMRTFSSPLLSRHAISRRWIKLPLVPLLLAAIGLAAPALSAQIANRIPQSIDTSRLQALPNHHPLWASAANDTGLAPASLPLNQLTLVLSRSPQQQAAFDQFVADQQNPASPDYHRWLTPEEVGQRFGLSDQDIASISGWLQSQGLKVNWVSPSRIFIGFGGTAADVGYAFQTEMHSYSIRGAQRLSVNSDPQIPAAILPAVKAIRGLYTIDEQPTNHIDVVQSASPEMNSSSGKHYITPGDFDTIYDVTHDYLGAGTTIGIVGWSRTNFADFDNFRQKTGVYFQNPTEVVPTAYGGVDPGPALTAPPSGDSSTLGAQGEATLDVFRAGSVAPAANLLLVVTNPANGGIEADAQYLVNTSPVPVQVMTISFGACESSAGPSGVKFWDSLFQTAAAEGISVFVSSGDSGASGCDSSFSAPPATPAANSPNYICSSSYATCVGGTQFADTATPGSYWSSINSSNYVSALGYIPEGAWNESTSSSVAATGGGVSTVIATPSWQTATGVPSARTGRYTPDVSFSGSAHDGYFACFAAGNGSCVSSGGSFGFIAFSGTSASAPAMAGVAALLNQRMGNAQGNLNPNLYQTAAQTPTAFNDVTVATSGATNCSVNTPSMCNNSIPGPTGLSGGQAGYLVGTGYDEVTGLGSLNIGNFLNSYAGKIVTQIAFTTPSTIPASQQLDFRITVSGGQAIYGPTGSVVVTAGGYTSPPATLTYGGTSFSIPAYTLSAGQATLTATYTPDSASSGTYSSVTATTTIQVTLPIPTVTLTYSPNPVSVLQPLSASVTVAGRSTDPVPTGSITFSCNLYTCNYSSGPVTLVNGSATINIPAETIGASWYFGIPVVNYTPDNISSTIYASSSGTSGLTVNSIAPTVTVIPASNTFATTDPLAVTVTVDGGSGNPTPVGTIYLSGGGYNSSNVTLINGSATFTVPGGTLTAGVDTLQASYQPGNQGPSQNIDIYSNASASATLGVTVGSKLPPSVTITREAPSYWVTQPVPLTVSVSSLSGMPIPTGTVVFSGGNYASAAVPLNSGTAAINIPALTLAPGWDTMTATYTPDTGGSSKYLSNTSQTVVQIDCLGTSIQLSLSANTITTAQPLTVTATVSGPSGNATPTGSVTLSAGSNTASLPLNSGSAAFTVPAGSLGVGGNNVQASYAPDANSANLYNPSGQSTTVTVTTVVPAFTVAGTAVTVNAGATTGNTSTVTITPNSAFTGSIPVTLTASITSSPAGAQYPPTFSFGSTSPVSIVSTSPGTATLTISTTASHQSCSAANQMPLGLPWYTRGGAALACLLLFGIAPRRRKWRAMLGILLLFAALAGGVFACGGGGGTGTGCNNVVTPGTTAGSYTITVTGTSGSTTATSAPIALTVQ